MKNIVDEIRGLVRHLENVSFSFCPHDRNEATHLVVHYVAGFSSFSYTFVSSNPKDCRKSCVNNFSSWVHDVIFCDILYLLSLNFGFLGSLFFKNK